MLDRETIQAVLLREDNVGMHAVGRALVHLYNRQTADERATDATRHTNNRGFNQADARRGTSMARYYLKNQRLTEKQVAYWQRKADEHNPRSVPRIIKYWAQLLEEAQAKAAKKAQLDV